MNFLTIGVELTKEEEIKKQNILMKEFMKEGDCTKEQ